MSRNAFDAIENEYAEREAQREYEQYERDMMRAAFAPASEFAPTICLTGHPDYQPNEGTWFDGPLDATNWLPAGSTFEIPGDSSKLYCPRLVTDRMTIRP